MSNNNQLTEEERAVMPIYVQDAVEEYGKSKVKLLKDTIGKDLTMQQLGLFLEVARKKKLDPFSRQIHAVCRWDKKAGANTMTIQTGIDGFRTIAQRTGVYEGQEGPEWCGKDGVWKDVWLDDVAPMASRIGVLRKGFAKPLWAVALFSEYKQESKYGLNHMWKKFPTVMLAKCAETIALRRAFPEELSGIYSNEEMGQADREVQNIQHELVVANAKRALEPIDNPRLAAADDDVVDAEFIEDKSKAEEVEVEAEVAPEKKSATVLLLSVVDMLDDATIEDIEAVTASALDIGIKMKRGQKYVEAYVTYTQTRVGFVEGVLEESNEKLVAAVFEMKKAAKAVEE